MFVLPRRTTGKTLLWRFLAATGLVSRAGEITNGLAKRPQTKCRVTVLLVLGRQTASRGDGLPPGYHRRARHPGSDRPLGRQRRGDRHLIVGPRAERRQSIKWLNTHMAKERCQKNTSRNIDSKKTLSQPNHLATKMPLERNYRQDMFFWSD